MNDEDATASLFGEKRLPKGGRLTSRCSLCGAPSVTNQKGYQRCEVCWELDRDHLERDGAG